MTLSLACIILGVGFFIVTQCATAGFQDLFIRTLLGVDGAIRISDEVQDTMRSMYATGNDPTSSFRVREREGVKYISGIQEPRRIMDAVSLFANVSGVAEVLHEDVIVRSSFSADTAEVMGIDLDSFSKVSNITRQIAQGSVADFNMQPDSIIIGSVLAQRLQLEIGDSALIQPTGGEAGGREGRRYRVAAIYETGQADIDRVRIYMHLSEARSLLQKPTGASYIQVTLRDKDRAVQNAAMIQLSTHHRADPWEVREAVWLSVFKALRVSSGLTVTIFTLIAGLAMFNTLLMIVMEKTKEIAILRSMGYTPKDISLIFIWQSALVLTVGCILGWVLGAGVSYGLSRVPLSIRGIFKTDTFPVLLDFTRTFWFYLEATAISVAVVMVASLVPARRAARLEPGDVIRGTAQ